MFDCGRSKVQLRWTSSSGSTEETQVGGGGRRDEGKITLGAEIERDMDRELPMTKQRPDADVHTHTPVLLLGWAVGGCSRA